MKKLLIASFLLCFAFTVKSQSQLISINDIFKMVECTNNSCMIKMARQLGFTFSSNNSAFSDDLHCYKKRSDISENRDDAIILGIEQFWNSVKFETYDSNIETEYKRLVSSGEYKEVKLGKSILGGVEKNFVSKNYPEYSASLSIDKISGFTIYSLFIMRWIKQ